MHATLAEYDLVPPIEPFALPRTGQSNNSTGLHTGAGSFVCKRYAAIHPTPALEYELKLAAQLAEAGLSFGIPAPLRTRTGALWSETSAGRVSLVTLLPGSTLDQHTRGAVDPTLVGLYGAAMGELHSAMARLPATPRPGRSLFADLFDFPLPAIDPLSVEPAQVGLAHEGATDKLFNWWRHEAARLKSFVETGYQTLPMQLCHNDVSPSNVLVNKGRVSGVIDFEFATLAPRALDVAMGLRMSTRTWEDPEPWPIVRRFMRAYKRWMPFEKAEALAMPELIRLRTLLPSLWWLRRYEETQDGAVILRGMGFLQRMDAWLQQYGERFVEVLCDT